MDIKKTEYHFEVRNGRHEIVTDQDGERTYRRDVVLTPTTSGMVFISYGPTEIIRLDEQRYKGLS